MIVLSKPSPSSTYRVHQNSAASHESDACSSDVAKTKDIGHGVEPGQLTPCPQRCLHGPACEQGAILGAVDEFEALAGPGKNHAVVTDDRPTPQRCKSDLACLPRSGMP